MLLRLSTHQFLAFGLIETITIGRIDTAYRFPTNRINVWN